MASKMISMQVYIIINNLVFVLLQNVNSDVEVILDRYKNTTAFTQFRFYLNQVRDKHTLEYGEFCQLDDYTHLKAIDSTKKLKEDIPGLLSRRESDLGRKTEALRKLLLTGHRFCKFDKLLYCDESTNRCKCGPHHLYHSNMYYIRGSEGNCLWAKDSACLPIHKPPGRHHTCGNNTHCMFTNNEGKNIDCDLHNLIIAANQTRKLPECYCKSELQNEVISYPDFENLSTSNPAMINPPNISNRNLDSAGNSKHHSDHKSALLILSLLIFTFINVSVKQ